MRIAFDNIAKNFTQRVGGVERRIEAVTPMSFEVASGEFFSIIGPSGCGKSTLLNLLAGLEQPTQGHVEVGGKVVKGPGPDRAVVFQEAGLLPWLTVTQNVEYGLKLAGIARSERRERALHFLQLVHLSRFAEAMPHQLSGGMRQRASIARALALGPSVLLMDEPFSALDAQTRDVLHEELQRIWQETKTTIVFVTHNLSEAVYLSDRVMVMTASPGRIKSIVEVPFPHPRHKDAPELAAFSARLHGLIRDEVVRVARRELDPEWEPEAALGQVASVMLPGEGI